MESTNRTKKLHSYLDVTSAWSDQSGVELLDVVGGHKEYPALLCSHTI